MRSPGSEIVNIGQSLERRARGAMTASAEHVLVRSLDALLNSSFAQNTVDHLLRSALAEHAVSTALRGPLVEAFGRACARYRVLQRAAEPVVSDESIDDVVAAIGAAEVPQRIADQLLRAGIAEAVAERIARGPELERIVTSAIDAPATQRLVAHFIESGVIDEAVARLVDSEEFWLLVDAIARSPAVTDAIGHQSAGLADQVAEVARARSRSADARLEGVARRLLHRPSQSARLPGGPTVRPHVG